jgi:GH35 family endo-1,4-beta-xylanase
MRNLKNILLLAVATFISATACTDYDKLSYSVDEIPESLASKEYLNGYGPLKTYVDRTANPNFVLGAGLSLADLKSKGVVYRILHNNFDEINLIGTELSHGAIVKSDGNLNFFNIEDLMNGASEVGLNVYGHTLCWHSNQNASYLNALIAPEAFTNPKDTLNKTGLTSTPFSAGWTSVAKTSGGSVALSTDGIINGTSAIKLVNGTSSTPASYNTGVAIPNQSRVNGVTSYQITFCIRSDKAGQGRVALSSNFKERYPFDLGQGANSVFTTGIKWKQVQFVVDAKTANMRPDKDTTKFNFSIDLGYVAGVTYYVDVRTFSVVPIRGNVVPEYTAVIEKTDQQKANILTADMEKYISSMMDSCKNVVKTWSVVNEPMSDITPSQIRTGAEKATLATDEFYRQDYMGKDYAVKAFQIARKYGNKNEKLYISETGLLASESKCDGLIDYVKYIDSHGATVDGIATSLSATLGMTTLESIKTMFAKLASSGKLIKVYKLDIGLRRAGATANVNLTTGPGLTSDEEKALSDFYKGIVQAYFEVVPAAQRGGIALSVPVDGGTSLGLWAGNHDRNHAYGGFANALAGKEVVGASK